MSGNVYYKQDVFIQRFVANLRDKDDVTRINALANVPKPSRFLIELGLKATRRRKVKT